jgi:hypothetical protein
LDMRQQLGQLGWTYLFALIVLSGLSNVSLAQVTNSSSAGVQSSLGALDTWLGKGAAGNGWRKFLETDKLAEQLALGANADKAVVSSILSKFDSKTPGLDHQKFVAVRSALADWLAELSMPKANELPAFTLEQKSTYTPITDEQVAAGKKKLQTTLSKLGQSLPARSKTGSGWRKYLRYDDLAAQVKNDATPNLSTLVEIFYLYTADSPGLERPEFTAVSNALANYIDLVAVSGISDAEEQYGKQLEALSGSLEKYAAEPSEDERYYIGRRLGELTVGRQAGNLISAVRKYYSQPNLFAEFSQPRSRGQTDCACSR